MKALELSQLVRACRITGLAFFDSVNWQFKSAKEYACQLCGRTDIELLAGLGVNVTFKRLDLLLKCIAHGMQVTAVQQDTLMLHLSKYINEREIDFVG